MQGYIPQLIQAVDMHYLLYDHPVVETMPPKNKTTDQELNAVPQRAVDRINPPTYFLFIISQEREAS